MKIISMNLVNGAVTEYENFPFTSFAEIGGRLFAAGADGLVEITGTKDDTDDINALVKFSKLDFSSSQMKRATDAYVEARSDGELVFHVYTDDGNDWEYPLGNPETTLITHRAVLGKGLRTKRWQFGITATADFEISEVLVLIAPTARRV